jgi:hypothetical protein
LTSKRIEEIAFCFLTAYTCIAEQTTSSRPAESLSMPGARGFAAQKSVSRLVRRISDDAPRVFREVKAGKCLVPRFSLFGKDGERAAKGRERLRKGGERDTKLLHGREFPFNEPFLGGNALRKVGNEAFAGFQIA